MPSSEDLLFQRRIYAEILRGYSKVRLFDKDIFIKHLSILDQTDIDEKNEGFLIRAEKAGLPKTEEKRKQLISKGLWSKDDDVFIERETENRDNLLKTLALLIVPSDIRQIKGEIEKSTKILNDKLENKFALFGLCAEDYAQRELSEQYIFQSLRKNKGLDEFFFSESDFADMDDNDLKLVVSKYNESMDRINGKIIKIIAASYSFQNSLELCGSSIKELFDIPVARLTFFQNELATYGKYFARLFEEIRPDEEARQDPDGIIDQYNKDKKAEKILKNHDGQQAVSVMGASNQDLAEMGGNTQVVNLAQIAASKGGTLNSMELMQILGN